SAPGVPRMSTHLEDFTLLQLVAGELRVGGVSPASRHLRSCADCSGALDEVRRVDATLRRLAEADALADEPFEANDPFRRRPEPKRTMEASTRLPLEDIVEEARAGDAVAARLLETLKSDDDLSAAVRALSFDSPRDRYGLLYAL